MLAAAPAGLADWFGECYGFLPELIWHAPGRVNLIGEHTDYNDGLVLPFAIELGVLAAAAARQDGMLQVRSRQMHGEMVAVQLGRLEPGAATGWAGYVAGAAWALASAGYPISGASVAIDSDLPIGAGLASSAALCCAAVSCLASLAGQHISRAEIAALARSAEADFVGMPCGIMDQSAAMLSEAGHALLLDCGTGASSLVPVQPAAAGLAIAVADTGVRHALADGQYAARRADCMAAARLLGVGSLGEVRVVAELARLPDEVLRRRARHVVTEDIRVRQVAGLLEAGHLADCGELLTQSHVSLRDDFEVSWPAADAAVEAALSAGALGARMTGGGFGGCVLVLVAADRVSVVRQAISNALRGSGDRAIGVRGVPGGNCVSPGHSGAGDPMFVEVEPAPGARQVWPGPRVSEA